MPASTVCRGLTVEIPPLTFRELQSLAEARLGAPLDEAVLRKVFADTGGVAGLARDYIDAAVINGRLHRDGREWVAHANLWSGELVGRIELMLAPLTESALEALELLTIIGVANVGDVLSLVDWDTLEHLERHRLVRIRAVNGALRIATHPPLLTDYFQSRSLVARRARLGELAAAVQGQQTDVFEDDSFALDDSSAQENALILRLFQDQAQGRMRAALAQWNTDPGVHTAIAAARAMMEVEEALPGIERILESDLAKSDDRGEMLQLRLLQAEWYGCTHLDVARAVALLRQDGHNGVVGTRVADAYSILLESTLDHVPADYDARLALTSEMPPMAQFRMLQVNISAQILSGDFAGAARNLEKLESIGIVGDEFSIGYLRALVQIGTGDLTEAVTSSRLAYSRALTALDSHGLIQHAAVLVYALEAQSRYAEAEDVLATVIPIAHPRGMSAMISYLILHGCAALIAARAGRLEQAQTHLNALRDLEQSGVSILRQLPIEAEAQLLIVGNQRMQAAELLWDRGTELEAKGYLFPGLMLRIGALEVGQDPTRLALLAPDVAAMGSEFVSSYFEVVSYFHNPEGFDPRAVIRRAADAGRIGLALTTLDFAAALVEAETREELQVIREELLTREPRAHYETRRFQSSAARLTERESEIAHLASGGLSNAQIATQLTLSVRTVENHMHRVIRKLGVSGRQGVRDYLFSEHGL
ncbi:helix-turn-helix transcriptional regulator [Leucobacter sp. cx-328]|uniref:helix-turn-helix transcriptional regulator n=1 Tax=unclassified Leucobacter TaxID=2621730 RepID=UPI00165E3927|nr:MULTISPECIES: LuxR C-terminal-related transcriptional regulator [unclassified Leucobacter]MBC9944990.1 helix-turn-helix transcriptional regulator [Leucobacter sp. cx-328]